MMRRDGFMTIGHYRVVVLPLPFAVAPLAVEPGTPVLPVGEPEAAPVLVPVPAPPEVVLPVPGVLVVPVAPVPMPVLPPTLPPVVTPVGWACAAPATKASIAASAMILVTVNSSGCPRNQQR
jgi:hypothetical protein